MHLIYKKIFVALTIPILAGLGCSSSSSSSSQQGQLINVSGLTFTTSSGSIGQTGPMGEFTYTAGDIVSFYVGGVKIGEAKAEALMTPLHFVDDTAVSTTTTRVTDVTRFLMAIDHDEFVGNGIQVTNAAHNVAASLSYDYSDINQPFDMVSANSLVLAISQTKDITTPSNTAVTNFIPSDATTLLDNIFTDTGPLIVHTTPGYRNDADQSVLPLINSIDVRFSSSVKNSTVDTSSYTVTDSTGSAITGTIIASGGVAGLTSSFKPDNALTAGESYTVSLLSTILDTNDMPLPADYSFSFTVTDAQTTPVACIDTNSLSPSVTATAPSSIVNINFSMMDCSGNAITGLDAAAFSFFEGANSDPVFDDDYETYRGYPTTGFTNTSTPMIIMIDNSTSVTDTEFLAYINQAKALVATGTNHFSNLIEGQGVLIYTFDSALTDRTGTAGAYTQDALSLWNTLDALATTRPLSNQSTSFYNSINTLASTMGASSPVNKKTLVILSDAIDTSGESTFDTAFNTINNNNINVYLLTQNSNIDPVDASAFNQVSTTAEIITGITTLKARSVNYIDSLYKFQYASPKRTGPQDISFTVTDNTNLTSADTTVSPGFNSTGFVSQPSNLLTTDRKDAVVVPTTAPLTVQVVSEFAPSSSSYSWSSNVATTASVSQDATDPTRATITGVATGKTFITINDNDNNLTHTLQVYVGPKYEWDFETNSLQSWSADTGWGVTGITAADRRNGSDYALSMPGTGGLYASNLAANLKSPAIDLTRFAGGAPLLEFKYKLRNANAGDRVSVEVFDNISQSVLATLDTYITFTHDWTSVSYPLNGFTGFNDVSIRFVFTSDAIGGEYEGFQVDDIKVYPSL
ncbi:MAG: hypothetical protein OEY11_04405 [Gammaproteobacteria bacterium]|nr:hypothetical protein [Gammaproteobacteria bacterium]